MLWIRFARFSLRFATSRLRRARPRLIGPEAPEQLRRGPGRGPRGPRRRRPAAAAGRRGCRCRGAARTSSRFTSGAVLATGIVSPSSNSPAALRARIELEEHVLEAGLRPQQDRRVLVDGQELAVDVHRHHRDAVVVLDLGDVADPDAGDADGLALPGVTAWAVSSSALSSKGCSSSTGIRSRWFWTMIAGRDQPEHQRAEDGEEVARWSGSPCHQPPPELGGLVFGRRPGKSVADLRWMTAGLRGRLPGVSAARTARERERRVLWPRRLVRSPGCGPVEVGVLGLAGTRAGTGLAETARRLGAEDVEGRSDGGPVGGRGESVRPAAEHPELLAVGVAGAALTGDADEAVAGLLVDDLVLVAESPSGRDRGVAPRDDDLLKQEESSAGLLQERQRRLCEQRQVRDRRPQVLDQAAQLGLGDQLAELADPRVGVVERLVGGLGAGQRLARERAQRREGGVELGQRRAALRERAAARRSPAPAPRPRRRRSR